MGPMGPLAQLTPDILAKMAAAGFRPPNLIPAPGLPNMPGMPQPDPGMAGFKAPTGGLGLGNWRPQDIQNVGPQGSGAGGAYTPADAMGMAGLSNGMTQSPMDASYGDLGGPGMSGAGGDPSGFMRAMKYIGGLF